MSHPHLCGTESVTKRFKRPAVSVTISEAVFLAASRSPTDLSAASDCNLTESLLGQLHWWLVNHSNKRNNNCVVDALTAAMPRPCPSCISSLLIKHSAEGKPFSLSKQDMSGDIFSRQFASRSIFLEPAAGQKPPLSSFKHKRPRLRVQVAACVSSFGLILQGLRNRHGDAWGKHSIDFMICLIWSSAGRKAND